jgi:hypothetical protein
MSNAELHEEAARAGHEVKDLEPRNIALFGAVLAVVLIVVAAGNFLFLKYGRIRYAAPQVALAPATRARERSPQPRLQVRGYDELKEMRAAEERVLHGYAWVDREKGIVRIPIEQAMELLAEKEGGSAKKAVGRRQ